MARTEVSSDLVFMGEDLRRPRWAVERAKIDRAFSGMSFYGSGGGISSVQGYLYTSYGRKYYVKVTVPEHYPYVMPEVWLPNHSVDTGCPHVYADGSVCVMKSDQWSSSLSIAYVIAKAAVWLNKYDSWIKNGKVRWPGMEQPH